MIGETKVKIKWGDKEETVTLTEAWNRYLENQKAGGPLKLQFYAYNAIKGIFDYQYPAAFTKNDGKAQDVVVFKLDTTGIKGRRDELDIAVGSISRLLIRTHNIPSLLTAQAVQNYQLGRCTMGMIVQDDNKRDVITFVPIVSADKRKAGVKYKYPAKEMGDTVDVFRVVFRDNSALATEFLIVR